MRLWTAEERDTLFDKFENDAFHLELRDSYHVDSEDESYRRWRSHAPADPSDHDRPWLRKVKNITNSGRTIRRVRIISEPLSEYIRYLYYGTPPSLAAGEDIRWLPRHQVPADVEFPADGHDWWLFDGRLLAIGHFDENGFPQGSEISTDLALARQCSIARDRLWAIATPHSDYIPC